jgi:tetratricopeptide (TPR) repeat protein
VLRDRRAAERALAHWEAFGRLAPLDPRVRETLFRMAIVHTKLAGQADLERAADAYALLFERTDLSTIRGDTAGTWLANLAETYMMIGRLDDAIVTYQRALSYANRALYAYGLAVALDRDEQGRKAREIMRDYVASDRLRELDQEGIFFVPEGERNYYLALGHEVMGNLEAAVAHYRLFIDSGAHPRYQPRAIANLRDVEKALARQRKRQPEVDIDLLNPGLRL